MTLYIYFIKIVIGAESSCKHRQSVDSTVNFVNAPALMEYILLLFYIKSAMNSLKSLLVLPKVNFFIERHVQLLQCVGPNTLCLSVVVRH